MSTIHGLPPIEEQIAHQRRLMDACAKGRGDPWDEHRAMLAAILHSLEQLAACRQQLVEAQSLLQEAWDKEVTFRGTRIVKWVRGTEADEQREGPQDAYIDQREGKGK